MSKPHNRNTIQQQKGTVLMYTSNIQETGNMLSERNQS